MKVKVIDKRAIHFRELEPAAYPAPINLSLRTHMGNSRIIEGLISGREKLSGQIRCHDIELARLLGRCFDIERMDFHRDRHFVGDTSLSRIMATKLPRKKLA